MVFEPSLTAFSFEYALSYRYVSQADILLSADIGDGLGFPTGLYLQREIADLQALKPEVAPMICVLGKGFSFAGQGAFGADQHFIGARIIDCSGNKPIG